MTAEGHGTHTASTAAGNPVDGVEVEGVKFGEVSGMAPAAKIAAYKVCFDDNDPDTGDCFTGATLAAIDDAIADGVDVINYSISGATDTVIDATEFAFEGAAEAGIFVATSAGNSGPGESTVAHNSPWLTTVAATTHHNFDNTVVLGNGTKIRGASISQEALPQTRLVSSVEGARRRRGPRGRPAVRSRRQPGPRQGRGQDRRLPARASTTASTRASRSRRPAAWA